LSETRRQSADRQWTPRLAHPSQTPPPESADDAAVMAVVHELIAIAERGLEDRGKAERIVNDVLTQQPALLRLAIGSGDPAAGEAARAQLAGLVRRAALDAMPPVIAAVAPLAPTAPLAAPTKRRPPARTATPNEIPLTAPGGIPGAVARKPSPRRRWRAVGLAGIAFIVAAGGLAALFWLAFAGSAPEPALDEIAAGTAAAPDAGSAATSGSGAATGAVEPLRLTAPEPAAGDGGAGAAQDPSGDAGGSGTVPGLPPVAASARLFVHYGSEQGSEAAASGLYTELSRGGGFPVVVLREVDYTIATPRVRFFHASDARTAERLTAFLQAATTNGEVWQLQNFTSYRPQPTPGTIEIYVPPG